MAICRAVVHRSGRATMIPGDVVHTACVTMEKGPMQKWFVLFFYNIPLFLTRFFLAIMLHLLEDFGLASFKLPFPRNRVEVEQDPQLLIDILRHKTKIIPPGSTKIRLRLHEASEASIADPDKFLHVFLFTLSWITKTGEESFKTICCKTSKFRGPRMAQLYLAGVGFKSREQVFYKYFANELKKSNVKVPQCYYSDVFPLTTHVFFLLEAINIDGIVNVPLADSMAKNQEICLFLREEARLHAYGMRQCKTTFDDLNGSIFPAIINTSKPLKQHRILLEESFKFVSQKCPQSLLHGDARLGNGILDKSANRVTIVDFEMCQPGAPIFDVVYCLWLCSDPPTKVPSDSLYSKGEWELIHLWEEEVIRHLGQTTDVVEGYAALSDQVLVASVLLWAYTWAVGDAGFGKVWEDGNNKADLQAWGKRIRQRIMIFYKCTEAHHRLALLLSANSTSLPKQEALAYVSSFIDAGVKQKVWTE